MCVCVCEFLCTHTHICVCLYVCMWIFSLIECGFVIPAVVLGLCLRLPSFILTWVTRPISGNWEQIVQDRPVGSAVNIWCYQLSPQPYQQDNSCNTLLPPTHRASAEVWVVEGYIMDGVSSAVAISTLEVPCHTTWCVVRNTKFFWALKTLIISFRLSWGANRRRLVGNHN